MLSALEAIGRQPDSLSSANLVRLVRSLRPDPGEPAPQRFEALLHLLRSSPEHRAALRRYLFNVFGHRETVKALTESGISSMRGFGVEAYRRLKHQLLPLADPNREVGAMLRWVFSARTDRRWLGAIDSRHWVAFVEILELSLPTAAGADGRPDAVSVAARLLAYRIASLGLESELTDRLGHLDERKSPFLSLSLALDAFLAGDSAADPLALLSQCETHVRYLRIYRSKHGTSLRLTLLTQRLIEQMRRLALLIRLYDPDPSTRATALAQLASDVVMGELSKNSLVDHVRQSTRLLAYQVTEHSAATGQKYITTTGQEYFTFLLRSIAGGLIVTVFAFIKLKLVLVPLAPMWLAFCLGLNYATCFVLIYLTGSALATKQPTMTAAAVARAMDAPGGDDPMGSLAELVVRVCRSQFVSFLGNLLAAFPAAAALIALAEFIVGAPVLSTREAQHLLHTVDPMLHGNLFFAGIAGICLFISGLINGLIDNKVVYSQIARRMRFQPRLRPLGEARREGLARFIEAKLGGLSGNISLGFFLGSAGTAGFLFGVPIDVRHIAFSAAHSAMAVASLHYAVHAEVLITSLLGVLLIGLANFLVSFSLALALAMHARKTTPRQVLRLGRLVATHLVRRPLDFFLPVSQGRSTLDVPS